MTAQIEQDLREAFHAAAAAVHPGVRRPPGTAGSVIPEHRTRTRRWLVPAVAAAVVAAIGLPLLAFALLRGAAGPDIQAASAVTVSGGRATVAGVSFPLPDGWTAQTVAHTDTSVRVCVAAHPAPDCDGVTVRIAVPAGDGSITPLRDPLSTSLLDPPAATPADDPPAAPTAGEPGSLVPSGGSTAADAATAGSAGPISTAPTWDPRTATCPIIVDTAPLGRRPAVHLSIGLCASGSPQSSDWFVTDGSLVISTPRGVAAAQAASIATGLDFSGYRHAYGPQIMFLSEPGAASSDPVPPTG